MGRAFEYRRAAKEKRWDKMSKLFPKLGRAITVAAKAGGTDPDMNSALRTAIANAKAENMPKDNIKAAIDRASGKDAANFTETIFEGKGPHGVLVMVETATDNNNRTVANIKAYFGKSGGQMVPTGSLEFMFDRKAIFTFDKTDEMDLEDMELELIDEGLETIELIETDEDDDNPDTVRVVGDYTSFGKLSSALEERSIEVKKANLQRIPNSPVEFSDDQLEEIEKLIDKLEDDDDVQAVFTNIV
ncbi:MAG: YebC/PmpR family DNA-binding transcriptional regulator [Flavobacteriales bacterium]|nr:YebC/PmpR family DNA-binding transcriptional regulator [Flavobacteriales bacterium]